MGVIEPNVQQPDASVRAEIAKSWAEDESGFVVASAVVFEGGGFKAAVVRAVATGMTLLARPVFPNVICATVDEGASYLATALLQRGATGYDAESLVQAMTMLRQQPYDRSLERSDGQPRDAARTRFSNR